MDVGARLRVRVAPKGWIVLGHVLSEEQGMREMAEWLQAVIPELPVRLIPANEPFWAPD